MVEEEEDKFIKENPVVFKKYKVKKKLGEGAFGDVYLGQTIENNSYVALKVEQRKIVKPILESEAFLLYSIAGIGIPEVKSFGKVKNYNILVEPLLGKSLFDIFAENHKEMPLEDVCLIGKQVIDRIQWVHSKFIVHRDIKPDNFLIGKKDPNVIYLIDFGLSKKYRSSTTNKHIRFGFTGKLTGTVRFASANALRGGEQSRRDDIESIGYMLVYFLKKKLPWQGVTGRKKMERYLKIYKMKKNTTPEELCSGLFPEMVEYVSYSKKLEFEQEPDYNYLRKLFSKMLKRVNNTKDQLIFSWIKLADLPNLKNPINPASRRDSPQSRIYKKIKSNLEKERNLSSDSDSKNGSYQQVYAQASVPTSNLKVVDSNNNFTESEFEQKTDKKLLKAKEGLNTTIANLDVTVDENVVDFENERMKRGSKDLGNFNESNNNNSIKNSLTNKGFPLKSKFKIEDINNNNFTNNTDNNTQKNIISDFKDDLDNNNNNNNNSNKNNIDIQRNLNAEFKNDLDINNIKDFNDNIDSLPNDNEDTLENNNKVANNKKSNEINNKINNNNYNSNNNSGNQIQNLTQNINSNDNNINSNKNFKNNIDNNIDTDINIKMNNFDGTEFTFNEPLDFKSNLNFNKKSKNISDINMNEKTEKNNENLDNDNNNIYALITGNTQYINNNNIKEFNKNNNNINKLGNEQNTDSLNNFHSEKKIVKINEFDKGNSSNNNNNFSSKEMNNLNQFDINNSQNNYKKFNNIKNRVEVKRVNRNKYNSKTMNNNQDINNTYNSKTLKKSQGINSNNNSNNNNNNSYNQMNIDFLNNLNRQNNREAPNNLMNRQFSNEKNINFNNRNSNEVNLNKMNNELFPNDGDINNNQMMNQMKKGYNNANRQEKAPNMHKKNKMGEIQLKNGLINNEPFNKTDNGKNNYLELNNDFLNNNKTLERQNKMGSKNKMFDFSNTEIGNNKYMGSNYNYPINNKNHGYSNTEANMDKIYGDRKMLNKNKMNNNNYMKQMDNRQNNVNPNNKEAILSKGSEDISNNYSNNNQDNNMLNNNYIKKITSNDSNAIINNTNVVKLDSYKFNSQKNPRLNGKKVTKIRKLNDNESYQGFKNPMSQSMTNNNINNKLLNNYQMTGYMNKNAYNNQFANGRGSFHPSAGKLNSGMNNQKYITINSSQNQSNRNFQIGGISPLYSNIKPNNYNIQGNFQSNSMYGFKI